jgi:hypothetical protein
MGAFNPAVLKKYTQEIKEKAQGGDSRVFKQKEIADGGSIDIRLLKPQPNQGGEWKFFVETTTYWINKKPYLTNTFLDKPDVIAEELEEARTLGDRSIDALIDSEAISKNVEYYLPIRIVEVEQDDATGEVVEVSFQTLRRTFFVAQFR